MKTKKQASFLSFLIAIMAVLAIGLGCSTFPKFGKSANENTNTANSTNSANSASNAANISNSNASLTNTSNSNSTDLSNSNSASNSAASTTVKEVDGSYEVNGANPGGGSSYKGDLVIIKHDEVYQFSWNTAGKKYDGVGVQTGNKIAAVFTEGADGKGCGVVLYKINPDGSLDGKAGYWGVNQIESETATRTSGTDLTGEYNVKGKNSEGKEYSDKISVKPLGDGYRFTWTGQEPIEGFGIKQGDIITVGIGGTKCGFVVYDIKPDGTLEGQWGGYGSKEFGNETAKKN